MSAAKLRALADKAVWAAAAGNMTELMPDDVRMLREAADALDADNTFYPNRITRTASGDVSEERIAISAWPRWAAVGLGFAIGDDA